MRCEEAQLALHDGRELAAAVQRHLDGCPECQALQAVDRLLQDWAPEPPMPGQLVAQVMAAVQAAPRRRAVGWEAVAAAVLVAAALIATAGYLPVDVGSAGTAVAGYLQAVLAGFSALTDLLTLDVAPLSDASALPLAQTVGALVVTLGGLWYLNRTAPTKVRGPGTAAFP